MPHLPNLQTGIQLTLSSSSSSGERDHHNQLVPGDSISRPFPERSILAEPSLRNFTLKELTTATENFRSDLLIGEGGFGQVFKGFIDEDVAFGRKKTIVAVKKLSQESYQGFREWMVKLTYIVFRLHIYFSRDFIEA